MFFKRKIYTKFLDWKNMSNGNSALLVEGARRIGKSTVVEEFAKHEYESYVIIDFNRPKEGVVDAIVHHPDDLDGLFNLLMVSYGKVLKPRNLQPASRAAVKEGKKVLPLCRERQGANARIRRIVQVA